MISMDAEVAALASMWYIYFIKLKSQVRIAMKTGRPKKDTEQISIRLERSVITQIDELRKMEPDLPSRPEMIRRIIDRHLEMDE